jgi:aldehyde:ferredoxin oxidoreductase
MRGYHKRILRVDLTGRTIEVQDLDDALLEKYVGGAGLGARLLYDETTADTDPLGPENILIAMTGPFTDTRVPSSSRHHVMARSPLTGFLGESNVGGSWAVHFKKTGYDGIVVTGKADGPVYLWINDGGAEIRDARPIMGKDSIESAEWLKSQTTDKASAAVIGPAGERMARIAGIPHVGTIVRQAARCGLGAVMGSKNLKAMVAYGTQKALQAREDDLKEQMKTVLPHVRKATETFGKYGTSGGVENYEKLGNFPLQNWRGSRWAEAVKISGVTMHDTILKGRTACLQGPIACGRHIRIEEGPYGLVDGEGPEYETIGTMGGECLVDDLAAICKANDLCNRYGLDTMSTGSVIAFAMEAFEKGLITTADTDGVELRWGSGEALVEMTRKIGLRQGIGELMGEGVMPYGPRPGKERRGIRHARQGARALGPRPAALLESGPVLRHSGPRRLPQRQLEPSL